jgi:NAD(P)-dependent dehydrogenase (short-subunit alcohol dehydrogenase family)
MRTIDRLRPLPGLKVLISGAATGIGAAIAKALDEVGANVYVCDIDQSAIDRMKASHQRIYAGVADVADREQVDRLVDEASNTLGGLDVLINNAGIAGPTGGVETLDPHQWERTVSTNLNSQFYFLRKAVPVLKDTSRDASIIAMSSVAGRLGYPFRTAYASTKWAIVGLVKSLAIELGPDNIRVNAILPGSVEGGRMDQVFAARAQTLGMSVEMVRKDFLRKISLRRMVTVDDVAAMVLFLCSPAANNISGQTISVDGNLESL